MWPFSRKGSNVPKHRDVLAVAAEAEREVREHIEKSRREREEVASKLQYLEIQGELIARRMSLRDE